jgi:hypothetical protein
MLRPLRPWQGVSIKAGRPHGGAIDDSAGAVFDQEEQVVAVTHAHLRGDARLGPLPSGGIPYPVGFPFGLGADVAVDALDRYAAHQPPRAKPKCCHRDPAQ